MLASSSTGKKLKPLVIGKAKQPRCFKNINIDNLRVFCNKKKSIDDHVHFHWMQALPWYVPSRASLLYMLHL
jgi:hypothetical protein